MYVFQPFITSKHSTPAEAIMEGAHLPSLNARANEFLMFHGTKPEVRGPSMGETSKNAGFFFRENLSELVNDLGEATLVQASIWQSAEELRIYINRYVCMYIYIYTNLQFPMTNVTLFQAVPPNRSRHMDKEGIYPLVNY